MNACPSGLWRMMKNVAAPARHPGLKPGCFGGLFRGVRKVLKKVLGGTKT